MMSEIQNFLGGGGRGSDGRGGGVRRRGGRGRNGRGRGGGGRGAVPISQPALCNQEMEVGENRGREREQGSGRSVQADVVEDALHQIRVQRQATQRRLAALPIETRRELIARKREAQLERMLLPDAPPRKRQTKIPSPERQPCIMVYPTVGLSVENQPEGTLEDVASMSDWPRSVERSSTGPVESVASMSDGSRSVDIGAEVEVGSSPSIFGRSAIGVTDHDYETIMSDWIQLTNTCDSDDDELNVVNDTCLLPIVTDRTAMTEPACDSDLTLFQAEVLQAEDDANDRAIRDIVPDDNDIYTFNWTNDRHTFHGRRESFTGTSGPTFEVTDQTRTVDIFDKMFDSDFIDRLCQETNRYAVQKLTLLREQNKLSTNSRFNRWTRTDRDEMISFLAVHIVQGLYPLAEEEAYFSFNGFGTLKYFSKIMSYNRFLLLKTLLHFVDNQTLQDTTRLCKIRPVINYFNSKFSSLYMPSQEIAIDKSLLKWHGRLSFAQKIASKAAQVGVKTYELCESSSGYLWKFFVYAGKDKPTATADGNDGRNGQPDNDEANGRFDEDEAIARLDDDNTNDRPHDSRPDENRLDRLVTEDNIDRPTNATATIVYDLIEPLLHRGHTLVMDNFYNSPLLVRCLKKQKTDCYGTLRLNREFVPDSVKTLKKTELRQGEVVATYCSDLSVMVWRDANIVSMISTYHNLQIGTSNKYDIVTYKPNIVLDYNKNMGGIDRKDQFLSAQPMERLRNRVWYKKLFRRMCNSAIFNCFVIFSSFHRKISHRQFRATLAEELLNRHKGIDLMTEPRHLNIRTEMTGQVRKTTKRVILIKQDRPRVDANHFPIRTGSKSTVCCMCKSRTIWKCEECNVNLCIEICLKAYHKP